MAYKNKVYVSMDADNDLRYYYLMKAWKQSDHTSFNFYDAHDINNIYDKSEASIKAGLLLVRKVYKDSFKRKCMVLIFQH